MVRKELEIKSSPSTTNNKNDIKVNNQFSLTINFGDSLNVLALIAGIYLIKRIKNKKKLQKHMEQWP
ncbi:hypothetical protein [Neobacillus sp. SAB-20_R2A]|uniref:hypothetical protein n=1 Tax=Neobacillus sp. SAB-20_R2A TaxID=3120519 RepID=UPI003C6E5771